MKPKVDMNLKREIAKRFRMIRNDTNLSQGEFAKTISVTRVYYNRMESLEVEVMPSRPVINLLCEKYNVNQNWLMTGNGPMYNEPKANIAIPKTVKEVGYDVNESTINNTLEFVEIKSKLLLEKERMDARSYFYYFQFVNSVFHLIFQMLKEMRLHLSRKKEIPEFLFDSYSDSFKKLLDKEKQYYLADSDNDEQA